MNAINFIATRSAAVKVAAVSATVLLGAGVATTAVTSAHAEGSSDSALGNGTVTARTFLSIRYAPSTHASEVGRLKPGAKLQLDCAEKGWFRIDGQRHEWVASRYVSGRPEFECGSGGPLSNQATAQVTIRSGPNTADSALGTFSAGSQVQAACKVSAQKVDGNPYWYLAGNDEVSGWVAARYVKNVDGPLPYC